MASCVRMTVLFCKMLLEIEKAIIDRLSKLREEGVQVQSFPGNPTDLGRPISVAEIFVGFQSETLTAPQSIDREGPIIQKRELTYEIIFRLKDLRCHTGTYAVMDRVRDLLTGFCPYQQGRALYQSRGGFLSSEEGFWIYSMTFVLVIPTSKTERFLN